MRRILLPLLGGPFLLSLVAASATRSAAEWSILLRRAGPVRYGMTIGEAEKAAGVRFDPVSATGCAYARATGMPAGLRFMIQDGRVVRADVDFAGIRTASGAERPGPSPAGRIWSWS